MKKFFQKTIAVLFTSLPILLVCLSTCPPAFADTNFAVNLHATYTISPTGTTSVEQAFELKNNTPTLFATQYAVEIGSSKLQNVRVLDTKGPIPANIVTSENKTSIGITFADKIVGEGKTRNFTIQFDNPDTAIISGNVLEVYVPKLIDPSIYGNYSVTIKTPLQFGKPARITPAQYTFSNDDKNEILQFDNLNSRGVSALFGDRQIFDFKVVNNIENPTSNLGIIQLALPPDTARQKVIYLSLNPEPKDMTRDGDGNWIATYEVGASKNLDVSLVGKAFLTLDPNNQINLPPPGPELTQSQKYWESDNAQIKTLAQQYTTPRAIYDYVVGQLSYNYNKVNATPERLGALGALAAPQNAICQEFTDLFIALARANQIPARRATGYAYTANARLRPLGLVDDMLHAWPEYYDSAKKDWVPVDPTWGNTTGGINYFDQLDFNHIVFAINGIDSSQPYSAGSYRQERQIKDNIEVKFGQDMPLPLPHFNLAIVRQPIWKSILNDHYLIKITNQTGVAWYNIPVQLESDRPEVKVSTSIQQIAYLLPYQSQEIEVTIHHSPRWQPRPFRLTATFQGISSSYDLIAGLTTQDLLTAPVIAISMGTCLVFITLITWGVLVRRRARHRPVRR